MRYEITKISPKAKLIKQFKNPGEAIAFDTCTTAKFFVIWAASRQNQQCGCAPSEDSDKPGHPPSLIRFFTVRMKKAWILGYPFSVQRRLWSDWVDAQADLSLRWAHTHFVGFCHEVAHMSSYIYYPNVLTGHLVFISFLQSHK